MDSRGQPSECISGASSSQPVPTETSTDNRGK
jgi:hypothetical protein